MMIMTSCQCFTYQSNQVMCVSSEKLQIITLWGQQVKCNALPSSIFLHLQDYRPSFLNIFVSWEFSFSIIFIPQKKNRDLKWISPAGSLRPSGRLHDSDKCDRSIFFSSSDSRVCKCIMHYIDIPHVRTVSHLRGLQIPPAGPGFRTSSRAVTQPPSCLSNVTLDLWGHSTGSLLMDPKRNADAGKKEKK